MVLWRDKNLKGKSDRTSLWIEAGEWALILGAVGLFTLTESYEPYVTFGLGLLCIFFAERGIRGKLIGVQSGLELPLFLFVLSAAVAAWISYNQGPALLQFARILGAAAIFFALKESKTSIPELVGFVFILAAAWLAVYWPLQNDFAQVPTKVDFDYLHWLMDEQFDPCTSRPRYSQKRRRRSTAYKCTDRRKFVMDILENRQENFKFDCTRKLDNYSFRSGDDEQPWGVDRADRDVHHGTTCLTPETLLSRQPIKSLVLAWGVDSWAFRNDSRTWKRKPEFADRSNSRSDRLTAVSANIVGGRRIPGSRPSFHWKRINVV